MHKATMSFSTKQSLTTRYFKGKDKRQEAQSKPNPNLKFTTVYYYYYKSVCNTKPQFHQTYSSELQQANTKTLSFNTKGWPIKIKKQVTPIASNRQGLVILSINDTSHSLAGTAGKLTSCHSRLTVPLPWPSLV